MPRCGGCGGWVGGRAGGWAELGVDECLRRGTLLWNNEHVPIGVGEAAVEHGGAGGEHVDRVAILLSGAALAGTASDIEKSKNLNSN